MRLSKWKEYFTIYRSGYFDASYYLLKNPDVRLKDIDPLWHFIEHGWKEGRNPSPNFDTQSYLDNNLDVKKARINPLYHFIQFGIKEGRQPGGKLLCSYRQEKIKRDKTLHKRCLNDLVFALSLVWGIRLSIKFEKNITKKVSIIIPNYNGAQYLKECLDSLIKVNFPPKSFEIIVVDNASTDSSRDIVKNYFPEVELIESPKNLGFSGGCNLGITNSRGEFIILLNNDTIIDKDWLKELVRVVESDPEIAIVGSKLLFKKNPLLIQNAGSYITDRGDGGDVGFYQNDLGQHDFTREVMTVCGASMLVKRDVLEKIGGFDEDFGSYYEDTDLCYRARLIGKKVVYAHRSIVYHVHAATLGEWSPLFSFYVFRNKLFLHIKNSPFPFLVKIFVYYAYQVVRELFKCRNFRTHAKVFYSTIINLPKLLLKRVYIRMYLKIEKDSRIRCRFTKMSHKIPTNQVKRIGVYNAYLPTMGGGEKQTAQVLEAMTQLFPNASIDILLHETPPYKREHIFRTDLREVLQKEFGVITRNIRLRFVNICMMNDLTSILGKLTHLYNLFRFSLISKEYDIFINNTFYSRLPAKAKVNIYYCMFPHRPSEHKNPFLQKAASYFLGCFLNSYHLFFANSNFTQRWIDRYWGVNSFVLYPSIQDDKSPIKSSKENIVINVGRFFAGGHNKKQDVLIKAFIEMQNRGWAKDWKLVLIGRKHNDRKSIEYIEKLHKLADGYPINLLYDVPKEELISYLQKAKIYWHATGFGEDIESNPEKLEHFGLSTLEAMQWGVVPIVFNAGGQAEVVIHGQNGYLWNDINELTCFTKFLCESENLWKSMSQIAKESIRKYYSQEQYQWLKEYLRDYFIFNRDQVKFKVVS